MTIEESETISTEEIDLKKEFWDNLKDKKVIILIIIVYWSAWILTFIFGLFDLNTLLMMIVSMLFVPLLFIIWVRTETKLNISIDFVERLLKEHEKKE